MRSLVSLGLILLSLQEPLVACCQHPGAGRPDPGWNTQALVLPPAVTTAGAIHGAEARTFRQASALRRFLSDPIRVRESVVALALTTVYSAVAAAWTSYTSDWNLPHVWQNALAIQPLGVLSGIVGMVISHRWLSHVFHETVKNPGRRIGRQILAGIFYFTPVEVLTLYGPAISWIPGWNSVSEDWIRSLIVLLLYAPLLIDGINLFAARWWIEEQPRRAAAKSLAGSLFGFTWLSVILLLPFSLWALSTSDVVMRAAILQFGFLLWTVSLFIHSSLTSEKNDVPAALKWLHTLQRHYRYPAWIQSGMAGLYVVFLVQLTAPFVPISWSASVLGMTWIGVSIKVWKESTPRSNGIRVKVAQTEDLSQLSAFREREFLPHVKDKTNLVPAVFMEFIIGKKWPGIVLVARNSAGTIVGYVLGYQNPVHQYAEIEELSVAASARGGGVGQKLLKAIVAHYQAMDSVQRLYIEDGSIGGVTAALSKKQGFYQHLSVPQLLFLNIKEESLRDNPDSASRQRQPSAPGFMPGDPRSIPHSLIHLYLETAQLLLQNEQYPEAHEIYVLLSLFTRNNVSVLAGLGFTSLHQGNVREAFEIFEKAWLELQHPPKDKQGRILMERHREEIRTGLDLARAA